MNSLSRTEFRNISQVRKLQTLLDAKHDKLAAAKKFGGRHLRSVPTQPEPANFCAPDDATPEPFGWIDSTVFLTPMFVVAVLILIARWSGVML